jgi:hypothetical protein
MCGLIFKSSDKAGEASNVLCDTNANWSRAMKVSADDSGVIRRLVDEADILPILSDVDQSVDGKEWARLCAHFDENVKLDLPTLGGVSRTMPSGESINGIAASNVLEKKAYRGRLKARP